MVLFPFKRFIGNTYSEKTMQRFQIIFVYMRDRQTDTERERGERERLSTSLLQNSHNGQD